MKCPTAVKWDSKVIDSRPTEDGERFAAAVRCLNCKSALPPTRLSRRSR